MPSGVPPLSAPAPLELIPRGRYMPVMWLSRVKDRHVPILRARFVSVTDRWTIRLAGSWLQVGGGEAHPAARNVTRVQMPEVAALLASLSGDSHFSTT